VAMSDEANIPREILHSAITETMSDESAANEGDAVVMGWVCVVESMGTDGKRWLSRLCSNATGDSNIPAWQQQGYLHNALNDWPDPDEDDDG
jgi:hypothetical protein